MRKVWYLTISVIVVMFLFIGMTRVALAAVTGTISGTILDSSGAALPNATVKLSNADTGYIRTATSNAEGEYEFLVVPIGAGYAVQVEAPGFQTIVHSNIILLVNQVYHSNFQLRVGSVQQTVTVSSSAAQVDTTSTSLGDVIANKTITSMPLNGRSYIELLALQPGVIPMSSGASPGLPVSGNLVGGLYSVNGAREDANAFIVNGADVEESRENGTSIIPNLDSIQEFRVLTDTYDAEYGRFAGGIVNVVTKSGTNQIHGTLFEFLRNDDLDARNYFNNNGSKGSLKQNQFGGAGGGPIIKNRMFFFADYQGTRLVSGVTSPVVHVPSALERGGNFSDLSALGFNPIKGTVRGGPGNDSMNAVLTQRLGYTVSNGEPYWVPGCDTPADTLAGTCVFPGEIIPQKAWSPAAEGMLQYIPQANTMSGATPAFTTSANDDETPDDKFGLRGDLSTKRFGAWTLYYFRDTASVTNPYPEANVPGFGSIDPTRAQNASATNVSTFGSKAVNDAEISFTRYVNGGAEPIGGRAPGILAKLGFVTGGNGIIPTPASYEGVPMVALSQLGLTFGMSNNTFSQTDNTYSVHDNFSKIVGRHTFMTGVEYERFQANELLTYNQDGNFSFQGGETGSDFADFLLGAPDSVIQASPGALNARNSYLGIFAQDSFKVLSSLVVNYGLRWDVTEPWSDTQNRLQTWVPGEQSTRFPGAPTNLVFAGDPGISKTIAPIPYHDLAPRLGIAYSPQTTGGLLGKLVGGPGKTSIHAGFGIFYTAYEQLANQFELGNPPFAGYYVAPVPVYLEQPYEGRRGQSPGQRFPYVPPLSGTSVNWAAFLPFTNAQVFLKSNVTPYNEQYNLNIQHQLGNSIVMMVGYVGTGGRHLMSQVSVNPGIASTCLQIAALGGGCGPFGEDTIYNVGGQTFNGTRPYSVTSGRQLSQGIIDFSEVPGVSTFGSSSYNALQTSVQKSAGSFRVLAAYTWSKSMDNMSGFHGVGAYVNPFNHALSYGLSAFNATNNFVVSYTYLLPFERLNLRNGIVKRAANGWQISGITRLTSGLPVTLLQSGDLSLCNCQEGGEPDYNGDKIKFLNPREPGRRYFSSAPFSSEQLGKFGTSRHEFFSGPGLNSTDLALEKATAITETTSIQFRAEFFNAFNHAQFGNPHGDYGSQSTFGVVSTANAARIGQVALRLTF